MPGKFLVALGLGAALAVAALAGVERIVDRQQNADVPRHAAPSSEPALPTAAESDNAEPSASPALTQ